MSAGPTDPFELLEQNLEVFIENVREVGIMVGDFQPQTQQGLNSKIESLVLGLKTVDQLKSSMTDEHF
jgi:mediator of RNA polymerase II transcription subunit 10